MNWFRFCEVGIIILLGTYLSRTVIVSTTEAQPALPGQETNFTVEGKITRQAPGKLTISTEENMVFHASYGEKTAITRQDGSPGSAKDLRVGSRVKIAGDLTESGEIKAQRIEIEQSAGNHPR